MAGAACDPGRDHSRLAAVPRLQWCGYAAGGRAGYTDNSGNAALNVKLSDGRANEVMGELVKLGTDAARMSAKGYGEEHPVADNATEEGRANNRRISLRVAEK